jgi:hypothetical protein
MNPFWAGLPIAVMAAVPLWTGISASVVVIEALAILLCAIGVQRHSLGPVTMGAVFATMGYAVALWFAADGIDVIGATAFGLALLFLMDLSEFGRRFHGATVAVSVIRGQTAYWIARAALILGAVALITLAGSVLASLVPAQGSAVIAGLGVVIAFAGAVYAGSRTRA